MSRFAGVLIVLSLAACKPAAPTLDPTADSIARQFFDEVRSGGDLEDDPHLARELKTPTTQDQIAQFRALIPAEPYRSVELRSFDTKADGVGETTRLMDVYNYGDHTLVVQTALFKSPGGVDPVIVGFDVRPGDTGG